MTRQVYPHAHGIWSPVLDESDTFILAKDVDGVIIEVVLLNVFLLILWVVTRHRPSFGC